MEQITVNAEFLFEVKSKQVFVNRVPWHFLSKTRGGHQWICIDTNGNVFECGADFMAAEEQETYPCKVYRLQSVSSAQANC